MLKICHISDTHLKKFNPEPADVLIHSGDALNYGDFEDLIKFRQQLEDIHKNFHVILFIPGNHDWEFEKNPLSSIRFLEETIPNLQVLHNQKYIYNGYTFYGTADQPQFCNWAFNRYPEQLMQSYSNIPDDVDVLITHCPPKGILDKTMRGENVGSPELAYNLPRLKQLKLHCFGHIHFDRGIFKNGDTTFSNGAICDESYSPVHKENIICL